MTHPPSLISYVSCLSLKKSGAITLMVPDNDPFDPTNLTLTPERISTLTSSKRAPRHRPGEPFLKGPVPWGWIEAAGQLSGKALLVGLMVWREVGIRKTATVPVNLSALGMPRRTAQRALRSLERAGLISVEHRAGRPPLVSLKDAPALGASQSRQSEPPGE